MKVTGNEVANRERPQPSFQRTLTRTGLLAARGRRDAPPPASGRWAGRNPALVRTSLLASGCGPLNSDRRTDQYHQQEE
jgi:hypothetical protein